MKDLPPTQARPLLRRMSLPVLVLIAVHAGLILIDHHLVSMLSKYGARTIELIVTVPIWAWLIRCVTWTSVRMSPSHEDEKQYTPVLPIVVAVFADRAIRELAEGILGRESPKLGDVLGGCIGIIVSFALAKYYIWINEGAAREALHQEPNA